MIALTRLNGSELVLNCTHIISVEATPDTVVTLTTGEKLLVRDSVKEIVARTGAYLRGLAPTPQATPAPVVRPDPSP